ncbi:hypothetical protein QIC_0060, partial [Clostridioides difficile DA00044]
MIENTSSTGIKNGLSVSLSGAGIYSSICSNNSTILSPHSSLDLLMPLMLNLLLLECHLL